MCELYISVVQKMNARYHKCLDLCKKIQRYGPLQYANGQIAQMLVAPVDKLIYLHALDLVSINNSNIKCFESNEQDTFTHITKYQFNNIKYHS